jgi:hypothetical protein
MLINKQLKGKVLKSAPEAAEFKIAMRLRKISTNRKLVWSLEVKPGEEKKLTYKYEFAIGLPRKAVRMRAWKKKNR